MKGRGIAVLVAFVLAAGATVGVFLYVRDVKNNNRGGAVGTLTTVIVSKQDIPAGTKMDDLLSSGALTTLQVPQDAVVPGAVTDLAQLQGQTTSTFILHGEQISTARLQGSTQATGGVLGIPAGYQAITIALEPQRVVNGVIQGHDHVVVYATLTGSAGAATLDIVPDVQVLGVSGVTSNGTTNTAAGTALVTLSLKGSDAEKVVLAQEQGKVWLSLLPPNQKGRSQAPLTLAQLAKGA